MTETSETLVNVLVGGVYQVNAFEYHAHDSTWRRMTYTPYRASPSGVPQVVFQDEVEAWRWWAGGKTGQSHTLASAQVAAKEAGEEAADGPVRYRVDIERAARNPSVLKATLYTITNFLKRWRVVYGEPTGVVDRTMDRPNYEWSPERSDQPPLTPPELEALHAGVLALEKHQAVLNPLSAFFDPPIKVTVRHPLIPGMDK